MAMYPKKVIGRTIRFLFEAKYRKKGTGFRQSWTSPATTIIAAASATRIRRSGTHQTPQHALPSGPL